jgi:hypothetical protein
MTEIGRDDAIDRSRRILDGMPPEGLFDVEETAGAPCRIGPEPFRITVELKERLERQGRLWLKFVRAAHAIYLKSVRGEAPPWIAEYLDAGKPSRIIDFGRMNRFKSQIPMVLRPDLILTEDGAVACELDSVPGGIGMLGCLSRLYEREGFSCVGSPDGMVKGFARALEHVGGKPAPSTAIVVSEESRMYRPEMRWLAEALTDSGTPCRAVGPDEIGVGESGAFFRQSGASSPVDVLYRFFELFDLPNVPGAEDLLNAAKLKRVKLSPPPKAHLEEKLLLALLHHPALEPLWEAAMGARDLADLRAIVIPTWVLDPRPLPPHATIANLALGGRAVQSWNTLSSLSQKERTLILKPSGFSEDAWGSHGVKFGSDLPQEDWAAAVSTALTDFPDRPWILQPHRKPVRTRVPYFEPADGGVHRLDGRVRLCPFYFVTGGEETVLGGVLATICPADKKAIHGMPDAIMVPCAVKERSES